MTRAQMLCAVDAYVRARCERLESEIGSLRWENAQLQDRLRERSVREASGAQVDLTDLRRVIRGYDNSRSQAGGKQSLQERIARELLRRMVGDA